VRTNHHHPTTGYEHEGDGAMVKCKKKRKGKTSLDKYWQLNFALDTKIGNLSISD